MRVTDRALQDSYLITYKDTKERLRKMQEQITNQSKINRPSDDPLANSKIMRLNADLDSIAMYKNNIATSKANVNGSIGAMNGIQRQMEDSLLKLTTLNNSTADSQLKVFGDQFNNILNSLLDYANQKGSDGNYLFSGTNFKSKPVTLDTGSNSVKFNSDISGGKNIQISHTSTQKINITGQELFQVVYKQMGNLNNTADPQTISQKIYNPDGTEFTLNLSYAKDGANNYDLTYNIKDSANNDVIADTTLQNLRFDATSGKLLTIGGNPPSALKITNAANKLDFVLDFNLLTESGSGSNLLMDNNQEVDIFNTLIAVRDGLKNGNRPNDKQIEIIKNFNTHMIGKLSQAGNIKNRLDNTETLLTNQNVELTDLLSKEKDIDQAKEIISLKTEEYNLNTIYRISSMILPKSLLDFLR